MAFKRVELGDLVKDSISGFQGVATQKVYYLQGCSRFCVSPQAVNKEGRIPDGYFFDEPQLIVVKKCVVNVNPKILEETRAGGFCSQVPTK